MRWCPPHRAQHCTDICRPIRAQRNQGSRRQPASRGIENNPCRRERKALTRRDRRRNMRLRIDRDRTESPAEPELVGWIGEGRVDTRDVRVNGAGESCHQGSRPLGVDAEPARVAHDGRRDDPISRCESRIKSTRDTETENSAARSRRGRQLELLAQLQRMSRAQNLHARSGGQAGLEAQASHCKNRLYWLPPDALRQSGRRNVLVQPLPARAIGPLAQYDAPCGGDRLEKITYRMSGQSRGSPTVGLFQRLATDGTQSACVCPQAICNRVVALIHQRTAMSQHVRPAGAVLLDSAEVTLPELLGVRGALDQQNEDDEKEGRESDHGLSSGSLGREQRARLLSFVADFLCCGAFAQSEPDAGSTG